MKRFKILFIVMFIILIMMPVGFGLQQQNDNTSTGTSQLETMINIFADTMGNDLNEQEMGVILTNFNEGITQSAIIIKEKVVTSGALDVDVVRTGSAIFEGDIFEQEKLDDVAEEFGNVFMNIKENETIEDKSEDLAEIMEAFLKSFSK